MAYFNGKKISLNPKLIVYEGSATTFYPSVSEDGVLSWSNDRGLPNPDPVNIKGHPGSPGKDGIDGKDGVDGKDGQDYILTDADKQEMVNLVLAALPNGDEVMY